MTRSRLPIPLLIATNAVLAVGLALLAWQTTAIGSLLFMNHGVAHATTVVMERWLAASLLLAALALAVRPLRAGAAAWLLLVSIVLAAASVDQGGYPYSGLAFGAHAMRIAAPLALLLLVVGLGAQVGGARAIEWLLLAATAVTFVIHGREAWGAHPWFVDLTIGAFEQAGWRIRQAQAETLLQVVGVVDIVTAGALVFLRWPAVAAWMAFWGFFTATLRIWNYGSGALGETLVRLPQGALPLLLFVVWLQRRRATALAPATA